jgi:hypothetical protein
MMLYLSSPCHLTSLVHSPWVGNGEKPRVICFLFLILDETDMCCSCWNRKP